MTKSIVTELHLNKSIHPLYVMAYPHRGHSLSYPSWLWAGGRVHPWQVASLLQGIQTTIRPTFTPTANLDAMHVFGLWEGAGVPGENPHLTKSVQEDYSRLHSSLTPNSFSLSSRHYTWDNSSSLNMKQMVADWITQQNGTAADKKKCHLGSKVEQTRGPTNMLQSEEWAAISGCHCHYSRYKVIMRQKEKKLQKWTYQSHWITSMTQKPKQKSFFYSTYTALYMHFIRADNSRSIFV